MDTQALAIVLGALLAVSEAMALIPSLKSNGILQLVINILKKLLNKSEPPVAQ